MRIMAWVLLYNKGLAKAAGYILRTGFKRCMQSEIIVTTLIKQKNSYCTRARATIGVIGFE